MTPTGDPDIGDAAPLGNIGDAGGRPRYATGSARRATFGHGVARSDRERDVEEQFVGVVAGEYLHADGQAVDEAARDRHRGIAVDVGDDGERAHAHEIGEALGELVEDRGRELRECRAREADAAHDGRGTRRVPRCCP